jgi:hypothetical protein
MTTTMEEEEEKKNGVPHAGEAVVGDGVIVAFGVRAQDLRGNAPVDPRRPLLYLCAATARKRIENRNEHVSINIYI